MNNLFGFGNGMFNFRENLLDKFDGHILELLIFSSFFFSKHYSMGKFVSLLKEFY